MSNDFIEPSLLAEKIKESIADSPIIIGIDGSMNSGKTILSYCLGCKLRITVINIDLFLNRHQGEFASQIKYEDLKQLVNDKLESGKSIIIEGICLLKILSQIDIQPDILVYVKRMSCNNSTWCEEQELSGNGQIDTNPQSTEAKLMNETIKYHNEFLPINSANYFFSRTEEA